MTPDPPHEEARPGSCRPIDSSPDPVSIAVTAAPRVDQDPSPHEKADHLAAQLNLPRVEPDAQGFELLIAVTPDRIEIRWPSQGRRPVYVDLCRVDTSTPAGARLSQPLAKAIGLKARSAEPRWVVDATAGLGDDAWLLASWGCRVTLLERHPVIAALLRDGLTRADRSHPTITSRIKLIEADARSWLAALPPGVQPEVVYLDPMFPARSKSAAVKKNIRLLKRLVGDDDDAAVLAPLAIQAAAKRVVIKRPLHAKPMMAHPTFTQKGKSIRYDVYVVGSTPEAGEKLNEARVDHTRLNTRDPHDGPRTARTAPLT